MYYAAYKRLEESKIPSYKCGNNENRSLYSDANIADKFSASITNGGNGQLEYPIAQITADEIAYAGGKRGGYSSNWYFYNSINGDAVGSDYWWTMSPHSYSSAEGMMFYIGLNGNLSVGNIRHTDPGIRPVLSLKSCVKVTSGNGSSSTPYEVSIDSTCAAAEN